MRKVILYISTSIDGFIADSRGKVDWIDRCEIPEEVAGSYDRFIAGVDTVIMGWNTYHQIITELSPDNWVYKGLESHVITHKQSRDTEDIHFTDESPADLIRRLKDTEGKDIWICGGASIVNQLLEEGLIDVIHLTILPITLGNGIRLFDNTTSQAQFSLKTLHQYADIIELIYLRADLSR